MSAASVGSSVAWGVIALLSVGVGGYALFHAATGFVHLPITNPMFDPWGLQTHVAASGVAMLLGAFQFLKPLRRKAPTLHRWMGRIYVLACVVGGLAGGSIALSSTLTIRSLALMKPKRLPRGCRLDRTTVMKGSFSTPSIGIASRSR